MTADDTSFDVNSYVAQLKRRPGVYRMYGAGDRLIYVGKARDVRRRVGSYFTRRAAGPKIAALRRNLRRIEVTWTANEVEALLLESSLIKRYHPRYNVLLRDDKSYPYIRLEQGLGFPRLVFYRGPRQAGSKMYGPYASAGAARATLAELQRVFRLRNCSDRYFLNRTRPCLQFQIERCSAPCVGLIGPEEYARDLAHAVDFLEGRDEGVIDDLIKRMEGASTSLEYEAAARIRDQVERLRQIRLRQDVISGVEDCDVLALVTDDGTAVVTVLPVRGGRMLGSRHYIVKIGLEAEAAAILTSFVSQHYLEDSPPAEVVTDRAVLDADTITDAIALKIGRRIRFRSEVRGTLGRLVKLAADNAREALTSRTSTPVALEARFSALERALDLPPGALARIECFDISHTGGEATTGSCVVFDRGGALKSEYRRYRLQKAAPGDDYAALAEVLARRYGRLVREGGTAPDLVLVDGGPRQVRRVAGVLARLPLASMRIAGVVKGAARRPSEDRLVLGPDGRILALPSHSSALHLVQLVRDEAHRFALGGHRRARDRRRRESVLDAVNGVGPARRRLLLARFGGLRGLRRASAADLEAIPGISRALAERIVSYLSGT